MAIKVKVGGTWFTPESFDNKKSDKPMEVLLKKRNRLLLSTSSNEQGKFNLGAYVAEIIEEIKNPLMIELDEGGERALVASDLFAYSELEPLAVEIFNAANAVQNEGALNQKNS